MESYRIEHLTFTYPKQAAPALADISASIERGSFVTVCGQSGCGKTTLLRQLKPALAPFGEISGQIFLEGSALSTLDARAQAEKIGFVQQNPENQIVTDKVWHELAFGLESLGYPSEEIRVRVSEMASFFGIQTWFHKSVATLSGGEKQLLNLAAVMAMQPSVLLLDEPAAQLDPIAARNFLETVARLNRELGTTVIMTEHRLEEVFPLSDRVLVLEDGRLLADGTPAEMGEQLRSNAFSAALPTPMRIYADVPNALSCPVTVREGRAWLAEMHPDATRIPPEKTPDKRPVRLALREVRFRYEKNAPDVLRDLSAEIYEGETYAIVGGNGTGKTTCLSVMSGLLKPYSGEVRIDGKKLGDIPDKYNGLLGVLPQNPQTLFVKNTVEADLYEVLSDRKLPQEVQKQLVHETARRCAIVPLLQQHPYDLSGGEQQRAALAKVLLLHPSILLLDEPTKGLDAAHKTLLAHILHELKQSGVTIVLVSHDIEFCAAYADRCAMFFDGGIVSVGTPRALFAGKQFYTTAANRMARECLPTAILAEEIIRACGGVPTAPPQPPHKTDLPASPPPEKPKAQEKPCEKLPKRTVMALLMLLLAVPLTIYVGMTFFGDRKYYFISLLILLEAFLPFAMLFEGRRPQAREVLTLAVLCAIAVAGRAAFFALPQFKPTAAIVIIAGVACGGEAGFLVGAMSAFVSNMFFGQGMWTPWQMFALGMIGFLAGILFSRKRPHGMKAWLCLFGAVAVLLGYGLIMNTSSVLILPIRPTMALLLSAYLSGIPFDLVHGAATVFFLWLLSEPMLEKLDRIKTKYGIL